MMKLVPTMALGAFCAVTMVSQAAAFTPTVAWSVTANACAATSKSINDERYSTGSYVTHRSTNVDPIILICPIQPTVALGSGNWDMQPTYRDSTGIGAGSFVEVRLMQQKLSDGTTGTITTFFSNTVASSVVNQGSKAFGHTFDFDSYAYFVQIKLFRTTTSQTVRAYNVAIWSAP